jgi:hypothetical protein
MYCQIGGRSGGGVASKVYINVQSECRDGCGRICLEEKGGDLECGPRGVGLPLDQ